MYGKLCSASVCDQVMKAKHERDKRCPQKHYTQEEHATRDIYEIHTTHCYITHRQMDKFTRLLFATLAVCIYLNEVYLYTFAFFHLPLLFFLATFTHLMNHFWPLNDSRALAHVIFIISNITDIECAIATMTTTTTTFKPFLIC